MSEPNDMTWLDQMLNKYANYSKAINESAHNTIQNASSTKVSRWSPEDSATHARPRVSRWSSQATAAYAVPQHYNSRQMKVATGNNYELEEVEAIAPPPPSWPTNEKRNQKAPTFTNSNETWLRITEVRGSVKQATPNLSESVVSTMRQAEKRPIIQQWLANNNVNEQQQPPDATSCVKQATPNLSESVVSTMRQAKKRPIIQQWLANNNVNEQQQPPDETSKLRREERQRNTTVNNLTNSQESLSVSIATKDYPTSKLTKRQMDCIQKAILNSIVTQSDKINVKPRFNGFHCKAGYITLNCEDKATADWTKAIIPTLTPWGGASLTAVDGEPFKLTTFLRCVFPNANSDENEQILDLVKAQNDGLSVNNWSFIKRVSLNNNNVMLLYAIDQQSAEQIAKVKGRIAFRFDTLHVVIKPLEGHRQMELRDKKKIFYETKKNPAKRSFDETKKPPANHPQDDTGKGSSLSNTYWL